MALIDKIVEEAQTDNLNREAQGNRLEHIYNGSNESEKVLIDQVMLCICGWTLKTLIEQSKVE